MASTIPYHTIPYTIPYHTIPYHTMVVVWRAPLAVLLGLGLGLHAAVGDVLSRSLRGTEQQRRGEGLCTGGGTGAD